MCRWYKRYERSYAAVPRRSVTFAQAYDATSPSSLSL